MSERNETAAVPLPHPHPHGPPTMAFVDAQFLQRAVCHAVGLSPFDQRLDVAAIRDWLVDGADGAVNAGACRRVLWYDGAFDSRNPRAEPQQRFIHAISRLEFIQPRLGHLSEITPDWHRDVRHALAAIDPGLIDTFESHYPLLPVLRQKGVDGLLTLDLARLAEHHAISHALLFAGDSDFAPALERASEEGVQLTLLAPAGTHPAARLIALADRTIEIPAETAAAMMRAHARTRRPAARPEASSETEPAASRPRRIRRGGRGGGSADRPALHAVADPHAAAVRDDAGSASSQTPSVSSSPPASAGSAVLARPESPSAAAPAAEPSAPPKPVTPQPPMGSAPAAAPDIAPLRFEPKTGPAYGGLELISADGTTLVYLTPLDTDGRVAVRVERDGVRLTAGTLNPLDSTPALAA